MKKTVSVIGTSPPCIRCNRTYKLVNEVSKELEIDVELEKAERYGKAMSLLELREIRREMYFYLPEIGYVKARPGAWNNR